MRECGRIDRKPDGAGHAFPILGILDDISKKLPLQLASSDTYFFITDQAGSHMPSGFSAFFETKLNPTFISQACSIGFS